MARSPDLYDWDTAFAVRVSDFNRLIDASTDSHERVHSLSTAKTPTLKWRFGAWSISSAVGSQIELMMPMQPGSTLEIDGEPHDLSACTCLVTTEMVFKPVSGPTDTGTRGLGARSPQGRPWATVEVRSDEAPLGFQITAQVQQLLDGWFQTEAALETFDAHFDGLRIDTCLDSDGDDWLAPRAVGFAGATLPGGDKVVGLLAQVEKANVIGAKFILSPYAIPDPAAAGFVISAQRFFGKLLLPALASVFGVQKPDLTTAFKVDGGRIRNLAALKLPLTTADGKHYEATIAPQQLTVSIDGDELVLDLREMSFDVPLGPARWETIYISMVERLHAGLVSPRDQPDHRVLVFSPSGDPQIEHRDEDSWLKIGGQLLVDLAIAIGEALLLKYFKSKLAERGVSVVASRLLLALSSVIASGVDPAISGITDHLAELTDDDLRKMPGIGRLLEHGLQPIHWRSDARFDLSSVRFADSLQFGVTIR